MDLSRWALPTGLAVAGIGAVVAACILLGNRRRAAEQSATAEERAQLVLQRRQAWQRRLAVIALAVGCVMMFVLAGIAAWLSFGAQREYAHAHNGGDWDAATGFALLLDAGALSLSLIRFFEALTLRSSASTRVLLLAFVSASAVMNLLHTPEAGAGSAFLAVVPPLVYAVLLEKLLTKIEQVIMGRQKRRKDEHERGYSLLLWLPWPIGAPVKMWKAWRKELLSTVDNVRVTGSRRPLTADDKSVAAISAAAEDPANVGGQLPASAAAAKGEQSAPAAADLAPADEESVGGSIQTAPPTPAPQRTPVDSGAPTTTSALEGAPSGTDSATEPAPVLHAAAPDPDRETASADPETGGEADTSGLHDDEQDETAAQIPDDGVQDTAADESEDEELTDGVESEDEEPEDELEPDDDEPDAEHGHAPPPGGDDEVRASPRIQIDLSTLPKDEGPRQRAERIYVAHQVAGLPLEKSDLARWAGYTNPRSGGNEYRRLVRHYGPILERKGAAYVDLDWSSLDQQSPLADSEGPDDEREPVVEQAQAA
ncbi:DUF2637 domain-containing protein [Streptomyces kronopolitis]|uniref:DUF2637 domain-containing protein n=1 Tax=Streptomyces kronopolitis TaxID=1612435 RepID=UPI003431DBC9